MSKVVRTKNDHQQAVVKMMNRLSQRHSAWEVWNDYIVMMAEAIANALGGPYRDDREKDYLNRIGRYSKDEQPLFGDMFAELVDAFEDDPRQDFLGELFMALNLGNNWKGQFFTPYDVCYMMSEITYAGEVERRIEKNGWCSAYDPACGAGATLIAFANVCMSHKINYQPSVLFVAQDIDQLAGLMCYVQLSILGCAGYVVIDDTIIHPSTSYDGRGLIPKEGPNVWYTPMYCTQIWSGRRAIAQMGLLFPGSEKAEETPKPLPKSSEAPKAAKPKKRPSTARKPTPKPKAERIVEANKTSEPEPLKEIDTGQLTLF